MKQTIYIERLDITLDRQDAGSLSDYNARTGFIGDFTESEFDYIMSRFKIDQSEVSNEYHTDVI